MKVQFINNIGAGFADEIDVEEGTSVSQFFAAHMQESRPDDFLIRVNRQHTTSNYRLRAGDRISITPVKIEGACIAC